MRVWRRPRCHLIFESLIYHSSGFLAANRPVPKVKCTIFVDIFIRYNALSLLIFSECCLFFRPFAIRASLAQSSHLQSQSVRQGNPFAKTIQMVGRHELVAIPSPSEIYAPGTPLRPVFVPSSETHRMPRVSIGILCRLTRRGAPSTVRQDCSILPLDTLRIHFAIGHYFTFRGHSFRWSFPDFSIALIHADLLVLFFRAWCFFLSRSGR